MTGDTSIANKEAAETIETTTMIIVRISIHIVIITIIHIGASITRRTSTREEEVTQFHLQGVPLSVELKIERQEIREGSDACNEEPAKNCLQINSF